MMQQVRATSLTRRLVSQYETMSPLIAQLDPLSPWLLKRGRDSPLNIIDMQYPEATPHSLRIHRDRACVRLLEVSDTHPTQAKVEDMQAANKSELHQEGILQENLIHHTTVKSKNEPINQSIEEERQPTKDIMHVPLDGANSTATVSELSAFQISHQGNNSTGDKEDKSRSTERSEAYCLSYTHTERTGSPQSMLTMRTEKTQAAATADHFKLPLTINNDSCQYDVNRSDQSGGVCNSSMRSQKQNEDKNLLTDILEHRKRYASDGYSIPNEFGKIQLTRSYGETDSGWRRHISSELLNGCCSTDGRKKSSHKSIKRHISSHDAAAANGNCYFLNSQQANDFRPPMQVFAANKPLSARTTHNASSAASSLSLVATLSSLNYSSSNADEIINVTPATTVISSSASSIIGRTEYERLINEVYVTPTTQSSQNSMSCDMQNQIPNIGCFGSPIASALDENRLGLSGEFGGIKPQLDDLGGRQIPGRSVFATPKPNSSRIKQERSSNSSGPRPRLQEQDMTNGIVDDNFSVAAAAGSTRRTTTTIDGREAHHRHPFVHEVQSIRSSSGSAPSTAFSSLAGQQPPPVLYSLPATTLKKPKQTEIVEDHEKSKTDEIDSFQSGSNDDGENIEETTKQILNDKDIKNNSEWSFVSRSKFKGAEKKNETLENKNRKQKSKKEDDEKEEQENTKSDQMNLKKSENKTEATNNEENNKKRKVKTKQKRNETQNVGNEGETQKSKKSHNDDDDVTNQQVQQEIKITGYETQKNISQRIISSNKRRSASSSSSSSVSSASISDHEKTKKGKIKIATTNSNDEQRHDKEKEKNDIQNIWLRLDKRLRENGISLKGVPVIDEDLANICMFPESSTGVKTQLIMNNRNKDKNNSHRLLGVPVTQEHFVDLQLSNIDVAKSLRLWDFTMEWLLTYKSGCGFFSFLKIENQIRQNQEIQRENENLKDKIASLQRILSDQNLSAKNLVNSSVKLKEVECENKRLQMELNDANGEVKLLSVEKRKQALEIANAQAEIIRLIEKENRCRNKARETLKKFNQKRVAARNSIYTKLNNNNNNNNDTPINAPPGNFTLFDDYENLIRYFETEIITLTEEKKVADNQLEAFKSSRAMEGSHDLTLASVPTSKTEEKLINRKTHPPRTETATTLASTTAGMILEYPSLSSTNQLNATTDVAAGTTTVIQKQQQEDNKKKANISKILYDVSSDSEKDFSIGLPIDNINDLDKKLKIAIEEKTKDQIQRDNEVNRLLITHLESNQKILQNLVCDKQRQQQKINKKQKNQNDNKDNEKYALVGQRFMDVFKIPEFELCDVVIERFQKKIEGHTKIYRQLILILNLPNDRSPVEVINTVKELIDFRRRFNNSCIINNKTQQVNSAYCSIPYDARVVIAVFAKLRQILNLGSLPPRSDCLDFIFYNTSDAWAGNTHEDEYNHGNRRRCVAHEQDWDNENTRNRVLSAASSTSSESSLFSIDSFASSSSVERSKWKAWGNACITNANLISAYITHTCHQSKRRSSNAMARR